MDTLIPLSVGDTVQVPTIYGLETATVLEVQEYTFQGYVDWLLGKVPGSLREGYQYLEDRLYTMRFADGKIDTRSHRDFRGYFRWNHA